MFTSGVDSFFLNYRPADSVETIHTLSIDQIGTRPEDFQRVIEVPSDLSVIKLHLLVQHLTGLNDAQIDAFYLASSLLGKKTWYKRHGAWVPENQGGLSLPVHEIFTPHTNRKLFYSFDSGSGWLFRVSKIIASDAPMPDRKYPQVVQGKGMKPI